MPKSVTVPTKLVPASSLTVLKPREPKILRPSLTHFRAHYLSDPQVETQEVPQGKADGDPFYRLAPQWSISGTILTAVGAPVEQLLLQAGFAAVGHFCSDVACGDSRWMTYGEACARYAPQGWTAAADSPHRAAWERTVAWLRNRTHPERAAPPVPPQVFCRAQSMPGRIGCVLTAQFLVALGVCGQHSAAASIRILND